MYSLFFYVCRINGSGLSEEFDPIASRHPKKSIYTCFLCIWNSVTLDGLSHTLLNFFQQIFNFFLHFRSQIHFIFVSIYEGTPVLRVF